MGMSIQSALRAGQRAAERLMIDKVRVERLGYPVTDRETGEVTISRALLYEGNGKIQTYEAYQENPTTGGKQETKQRYRADIPVGSCAPAIGDVVTVVAARIDPNLVERQYRVVALLHKSLPTAYRLGVEDVD